MADDLIARTKQELTARIAELEALTEELPRLKKALEALSTEDAAARRGPGRPRGSKNAPARQRRPRGANRDAILKVVSERPGVSVGEVATVVAQHGVKKNVVYTTVNKLVKDGAILKAEDGTLTGTTI